MKILVSIDSVRFADDMENITESLEELCLDRSGASEFSRSIHKHERKWLGEIIESIEEALGSTIKGNTTITIFWS